MTVVGRITLAMYRLFARSRNKAFSVLASGAFAEFGSNTVIELPIRLAHAERIAFGSGVFVGSGSWLQAVPDPAGSADVAIRIGNNCGFAGGAVISAVRSVTIGSDVHFARGCYLADHSHAYDDPGTTVKEQGLTDIRPVVLEDGVWLGENVVVLPGVTIGRGAVIGANSVVGVDIPAHCVALGVPARVIRHFGPDAAASR